MIKASEHRRSSRIRAGSRPRVIIVLALLVAFGLAITLTAATSASGSHDIMGRVEASQLPELAQSAAISNLAPPRPGANGVPMPDHVVIVMEENHSYSEIIGSPSAPYINSLIPQGALFSQSFAVTHPSQPNYADLFSGSNQGVTDDSSPIAGPRLTWAGPCSMLLAPLPATPRTFRSRAILAAPPVATCAGTLPGSISPTSLTPPPIYLSRPSLPTTRACPPCPW